MARLRIFQGVKSQTKLSSQFFCPNAARNYFRAAAFSIFFLTELLAHATIVGPYSVDANTLHLWHLNESSVPAIDSAPGGTNLTVLANGATLGNSSFAGFGSALNTFAATNAYLAPKTLVVGTNDDVTMSYADSVTGAFTYEALVRVDFDPATFNRTLPLYLITGENDSGEPNSTRAFQFRIMPNGAALAGTTTTDYRLHFFNAKDNGSYFAVIPMTGSNALVSGGWYHVAVTYDGNDGTPGNMKLFWTLMNSNRVQANELPGSTLVTITDLSTNATPDFCLGNVGRTTPNSSWPGMIDEVRMSKIARSSADMMFNSTNVIVVGQPASQVVAEGDAINLNVTASGAAPLRYQWRFNSQPILNATQNVFSVASAQLSNSGDYDVVVGNNFNSVTSSVANVVVATTNSLVWLDICASGTNLLVSWPVSVAPWKLQVASNSMAAADWQFSANPAVTENARKKVSFPNDGSRKFFRLVAPFTTNSVSPIDWSRFSAGAPSDANAPRATLILQRACQYAMTTWWNTARNYAAQDASAYLDFGGIGESNIRSPAMEAYGLAVALQTGIYDSALAGVSTTDARNRSVKLIRSLGYRHLVNQSGGWGNDWQTAHWAALTGTAAWILWNDLATTDREYVRRMVEYEANRFTNYTVPYYQNRSGTIIFPGDTKCEENAWNASVLHLAVCMMPAHANASNWWSKAIELTLSVHARPSDINRTNVFHGKTLAEWLNGSNANEDSTVINHGIVHPDYMAAGLCEFQPALVYLLGNKPVPSASFFNLDKVFQALVDLNFVVGATPYPTGQTNRAPGGPMYARDAFNQPGTNIYYPNGNDWGTSRRMHFATMDATINALGLDGTASIASPFWETQHDQAVLDMQARFTDGRTYGASTEDTYGLREEWVCNYAAKNYLTKWLAHQGQIQISNEP